MPPKKGGSGPSAASIFLAKMQLKVTLTPLKSTPSSNLTVPLLQPKAIFPCQKLHAVKKTLRAKTNPQRHPIEPDHAAIENKLQQHPLHRVLDRFRLQRPRFMT